MLKQPSNCPQEHFLEENLWKKIIYFFKNSLTFNGKFSKNEQKFLAGKLHSTCSEEHFGTFFFNFDFFSVFQQKIPAEESKLLSTCPEDYFQEKKLRKFINVSTFSHFD